MISNQSKESQFSLGNKVFIVTAFLYCSWNMLYSVVVFFNPQSVDTCVKCHQLVSIMFSFALAGILLAMSIFRQNHRFYYSNIVLMVVFVSLGLFYVFDF